MPYTNDKKTPEERRRFREANASRQTPRPVVVTAFSLSLVGMTLLVGAAFVLPGSSPYERDTASETAEVLSTVRSTSNDPRGDMSDPTDPVFSPSAVGPYDPEAQDDTDGAVPDDATDPDEILAGHARAPNAMTLEALSRQLRKWHVSREAFAFYVGSAEFAAEADEIIASSTSLGKSTGLGDKPFSSLSPDDKMLKTATLLNIFAVSPICAGESFMAGAGGDSTRCVLSPDILPNTVRLDRLDGGCEASVDEAPNTAGTAFEFTIWHTPAMTTGCRATVVGDLPATEDGSTTTVVIKELYLKAES